MGWRATDDRWPHHRKRLLLMRSEHHDTAVALWDLAGAWCAGQKVEMFTGFVPEHVPWSFGLRGDVAAAAGALVSVGLWEWSDDPTGWTFHDWDDWNGVAGREWRSKEQTRLRTKATRIRACERGEHSKDCPTTDLDDDPRVCPKRADKEATKEPRTPRSATPGRDGTGRAGHGLTNGTNDVGGGDDDPRVRCPDCGSPEDSEAHYVACSVDEFHGAGLWDGNEKQRREAMG